MVREESIEGTEPGRPDYTGAQHRVRRSQAVKEMKLKPNELLKSYALMPFTEASPYPYVRSPMSPGESAYLVDQSTGVSMPDTISAGYNWKILVVTATATNPSHGITYLDGYPAISLFHGGGKVFRKQEMEQLSLDFIDPDLSDSHTVSLKVVNDGSDNLAGAFRIVALMEAAGTPSLPDTKTIRCKNCGSTKEVEVGTTSWTCDKCGFENRYFARRTG